MENLKKRVLRRVFAPKGDGVTGSWGSYVLESFITCAFTKHSCSSNKSRWKKGVGLVALMRKGKMHINCSVENWEERKCWKFIGGRIILILILKKEVGKCILDGSSLLLAW
jgi:hypothetical protein